MAQTAVDHKAQWETVNRVVYPVKDTDLTLPLYAVNWHPSHLITPEILRKLVEGLR